MSLRHEEPTVLVRRPGPDGESYGMVRLMVADDGGAIISLKDADGTRRTITTQR